MLLRLLGSKNVLETLARLPEGESDWHVDPSLPLGDEAQLHELLRLLGIPKHSRGLPPGCALFSVRGGIKGGPIDLSLTPAENGLMGEVWVDLAPAPPDDPHTPPADPTPHRPVATIALHGQLASFFQNKNMLYARMVAKRTKRGGWKERVLLLLTKVVYLCHPNAFVTRMLTYLDIKEAVVLPQDEGDLVLLRAIPPEHDILISLINHHLNTPPHTTADELALLLHRSGVKIVPWEGTALELVNHARLMKDPGYITPEMKLKAFRQCSPFKSPTPVNHAAASVNSWRGSGRTAKTDESRSDAAPESHSPPLANEALEQHQERLAAMTDEVAKLKEHNLALAKSMLEASKALSPTSTASAKAPHPVQGSSKALVICSSYGDPQYEGHIKVASRVQQFLESMRFIAQLQVLTDSNPAALPTKANIMAAIHWLVVDARPGDSLWLSIAGCASHSSPEQGPGGLWPIDSATEGGVSPKELYEALVDPLPPGVVLHMLCDTQPTSIGIPLPYRLMSGTDGMVHIAEKPQPTGFNESRAQVVILGAAPPHKNQQGAPPGSLSIAFLNAATGLPVPSYEEVLDQTRAALVAEYGPGVPLPVIASTRKLTGNMPFTLDNNMEALHPPTGGEWSHLSNRSIQPRSPVRPARETMAPRSPLHHHHHHQQHRPPTPVSEGPGPPLTAFMTNTLHPSGTPKSSPREGFPSAAPSVSLTVPLMAPFVHTSPGTAPENFTTQQTEDQDFWRNLVRHAFLVPTAFDAPHVLCSSTHTGTHLRLNRDYVAAFVSQWPVQHPLIIHLRMVEAGHLTSTRSFRASRELWVYFQERLQELLGQRAVQRLMYPHSRDAQRRDNVVVTVEGMDGEEEPDMMCNDDDWNQTVLRWEVDSGFAFSQSTLPVPLMPPFKLPAEDPAPNPNDARIVSSLQLEMGLNEAEAETNVTAAKSISFQYDADFVRNLQYHIRLMPGARQPPLFIVEDSSFSHPILVNQTFLLRYVIAWGKVHPHTVYVHDKERNVLVARCRTNEAFWKYFSSVARKMQASMGSGRVLTLPGDSSSKLGMHLLVVTTSANTECLTVWDVVWCAVVKEWDGKLPQADRPWSPRLSGRTMPSPWKRSGTASSSASPPPRSSFAL